MLTCTLIFDLFHCRHNKVINYYREYIYALQLISWLIAPLCRWINLKMGNPQLK